MPPIATTDTEAELAELKENAQGTGALPGIVYLVGAGPGDPGLITVRAAELLATADIVLHDELVHPSVLAGVRDGAEVRSVGKRGGAPAEKQAKQATIEAELISLARERRSVVRLKGGDPFLFGRGSEEAEALIHAGIPFEVVPGVPSPLGATAYAGISVTHRDFASSVTFVSGTTRAGIRFDWTELAFTRGTLCVLMGMHDLREICARLIRDARRPPETPAAVIQWGTLPTQAVVEGRLDGIATLASAAKLGSPGILVVGMVAALRRSLRWFDLRPLFGKRILLARPRGQSAAAARLLRLRGAEPIELPAIAIHPPPDPARVAAAARALDSYDVVAFTSENGVDWLFRELDAQRRDARAFGRARIAAIGPGTAAALAARGIRADIVPAREYRGEALAQAILDDLESTTGRSDRPRRVLIPRALIAREILAERLRAADCEVEVVPVYETRPASAADRGALLQKVKDGGIDIVMLTSSSTADSLADLLGPTPDEMLAGVMVASIGPITTFTANKRGLTVDLTASESTILGLITAIERHIAGATIPGSAPEGAAE